MFNLAYSGHPSSFPYHFLCRRSRDNSTSQLRRKTVKLNPHPHLLCHKNSYQTRLTSWYQQLCAHEGFCPQSSSVPDSFWEHLSDGALSLGRCSSSPECWKSFNWNRPPSIRWKRGRCCLHSQEQMTILGARASTSSSFAAVTPTLRFLAPLILVSEVYARQALLQYCRTSHALPSPALRLPLPLHSRLP